MADDKDEGDGRRRGPVLAWMKKIDARLEVLAGERDTSLAEIDAELEDHAAKLAAHDDAIADHERRIKRLERKLQNKAGGS